MDVTDWLLVALLAAMPVLVWSLHRKHAAGEFPRERFAESTGMALGWAGFAVLNLADGDPVAVGGLAGALLSAACVLAVFVGVVAVGRRLVRRAGTGASGDDGYDYDRGFGR